MGARPGIGAHWGRGRQGEGSVWDRELGGKEDPAFAYRERAAPTVPPPVRKAPAKPAAPRVPSSEERERLERNDMMRRAKELWDELALQVSLQSFCGHSRVAAMSLSLSLAIAGQKHSRKSRSHCCCFPCRSLRRLGVKP